MKPPGRRSLPGISWRGTCAKLKPLLAQVSRTSLQFRALKSALAATESREKVQTRVSSLSMVQPLRRSRVLQTGWVVVGGSGGAGGGRFLCRVPAFYEVVWGGGGGWEYIRFYQNIPSEAEVACRWQREEREEEHPGALHRCHMNPGGASFPPRRLNNLCRRNRSCCSLAGSEWN